MAAPHVAGVLALMFALDSSLSSQAAVGKLYTTATDLGDSGWDTTYAYGEVNALAAVGGQAIKGADECPISLNGITGSVQYSIAGAKDEGSTWEWSVDKPSIAEVDKKTGKLSGKALGSVTLTATSPGNPHSPLTKKVTIVPVDFECLGSASNSPESDYPVQARIYVNYKKSTYTGFPLEPAALEVKFGTSEDTAVPLEQDKDYTIDCQNNTNAGAAALIVITGKDNFINSKRFYYAIERASITSPDVAITVSPASMPYTGKEQKASVSITYKGKKLKEGTDYALEYSNNVKIGNASVKITGKGNFKDSMTKGFMIAALAQPAVVKALKKTVKVKYKDVKKKKKTVASPVSVTGATGDVTYSIQSVNKKAGKKKIAINSKNGKITVKKGCKKGSYKVVIRVTVEKSAGYNGATYTVPVTVSVK